MQTIRDDMSEAGLRRLHLLDGKPLEIEAEAWRVEEGAHLVEWAAFEDEIGMHHLHMYWRFEEMPKMMVVVATYKQDYAEALSKAAWRYREKCGTMPNRAYVHEGVAGADRIEVRGEDGGPVCELEIKRVKWMLKTDVGVCYEEV